MLFMGSVGFIMAGSGLKEVWETVYAPKSTETMLTVHIFVRAVRAHLTTHAALGQLVLDDMAVSCEDKVELQTMLQCCKNHSNISKRITFIM